MEPDPDGNLALHFLASRLVGDRAGASAAAGLFRKFLTMGLDVNSRNKKERHPFSCSCQPVGVVPTIAPGKPDIPPTLRRAMYPTAMLCHSLH